MPVRVQSKIKKDKPEKDEKDEKVEKVEKVKEEFEKLDEKIEAFEEKEEKRFKEEVRNKRKRFRLKKFTLMTYALLTTFLVLLTGGVYSAIEFLPKAEIKIVTEKSEWSYVDSITASKESAEIDFVEKQIPAEIFSVKKNYNFSFAATGKKAVEEKATGEIVIYNVYSSDSQVLVANTRFESPDGKIFRLKEKIIVPGAKIIEGKITPSSINATVVADQAGPQYNIGPVSRFSIPGFEGSPKYEGFYASSQKSMTGGFIGERAYPTDEDIAKAKEEAKKGFKDYVNSFLSLQIPPEFKIIEGADQFTVLKEEVNKEVNEAENFTIFLEGESLNVGFRESDLKTLLENLAQNDLGTDFKIKTYELEYGVGRADFDEGKISFAVNFHGVFERPVDVESFREQILNKNEAELKGLVSLMPNIRKTTVSFWPFWVKRVPDDLKRVIVEVE